jgi:hypothetical protein
LAHPLLAPPVDGHEEDAERPARLAGQGLEVEERVGRREGEVPLQLEAHHASEIRTGDDRQLHGLRDHRAPREADLRPPGADARLEKLAPDGGRRVIVGGNAEGGEEALPTETTPERHDVDLSIPLTIPCLARTTGREPSPAPV